MGLTAEEEIIQELQTMDVNVLTPIEAMNQLFTLWKKAQSLEH